MPYSIEHRTLGLNFPHIGLATILVWAPFANNISVVFEESEPIPLMKKAYGYWKSEVSEVHQGDKYQFIIDDKRYPDPASLLQPESVHGYSQAVNLHNYNWNDADWKGISPDELVIYELHTGTFSEQGTFEAITEKLKYLKHLGITAIEIMPVAQFPGDRNWGYDGVFPFAVQNSYGGPHGLQKFVDSCHQEGIAVILDVVYNHLGPEGNYLSAFGPYFTDKYKTPWGQALNFEDEWCDGVRRFYIENALMWLRDFHIDGLRLDAVHAIKDFSAKHILEQMKEYVDRLNDLTGKTHFLTIESDLNDVRFIKTPGKGGYGLDHQWCDEFHHALHALVTGETIGYYSDFGQVNHLAKSFNDAFVYDGVYSPHRKKIFGNKTTGLPGYMFVVFTQNHDQVGNRMLGDRLSTLVDYGNLKLVAGTMLMSPYTPLIFMGEEYGETNPFLYFTSHGDDELIRMVREGRKNEFAAFTGEGEAPDPQSVSTFNRSKLEWKNHTENQLRLFAFYKELIRLRKHHPVLKNTDRDGITAQVSKQGNVIVLLRQHQENIVIAIMNFETEDVAIDIAPSHKSLYILIDSSQNNWTGPQGISLDKERIKINAKSILVLSDVTV